MKTLRWENCYDSSWKGMITNEAFAHPAKFSRDLIERIYDHMLARDWIRKGDTVGDPFGGIGTGGITAAYRGLNWIGVELEQKFVNLAGANFDLHAHKWLIFGGPRPTIRQGDSRQFAEIVDAVVSSPPYAGSTRGNDQCGIDWEKTKSAPTSGIHQAPGASASAEYGSTPGQIERLGAGTLDAAITSPPWEANAEGSRRAGKFKSTAAILKCNRGHGASDAAVLAQAEREDQKTYGDSPGQIGQLKGGSIDAAVTSPPYGELGRGGPDHKPGMLEGSPATKLDNGSYGTTPGQIGALNGAVTSPPYASISAGAGGLNSKPATKPGQQSGRAAASPSQDTDQRYGTSPGQIARESPETYWQAMAQVYAQCFAAIKPGGVIAVVVKDYVKDKKRVPLSDDTLRLLQHLGFQPLERVHAMLTATTTHGDLFNGHTTTTKSRKSFFRRLAEKKGSPPIDHEDVLFLRRP